MKLIDKILKGELPSMEEIQKLPFSDGQNVVTEIRKCFSNPAICKKWKISTSKLNEFFKTFQVAKIGKQIVVGEEALNAFTAADKKRQEANNTNPTTEPSTPSIKGTKKRVSQESVKMDVCKKLSSQELSNLIGNLGSPETKYLVTIKIEEIV